MARKLIVALTLAAGFVGLAVFTPQTVVRLLELLFPNILWRIETSERVIALTFDDGPDPTFTPAVLRILESADIEATFFLVGERARRFPDIIQSIREAGHAIGNHSDSWRRTIGLSGRDFEQDLLQAERSLKIETQPKFFRPAAGLLRPEQMRLLKAHDYQVVLGSAYAFDPYRPSPTVIQWAIGQAISPGAIIVLHDSGGDRSNTVAALPTIINNAKQRGFRFETLPQLTIGSCTQSSGNKLCESPHDAYAHFLNSPR